MNRQLQRLRAWLQDQGLGALEITVRPDGRVDFRTRDPHGFHRTAHHADLEPGGALIDPDSLVEIMLEHGP